MSAAAVRKPDANQVKIFTDLLAAMHLRKDGAKAIEEKVLSALATKQFACIKAFFMKPYVLSDDFVQKSDAIYSKWTKEEKAMVRIPKSVHKVASQRIALAPIDTNANSAKK